MSTRQKIIEQATSYFNKNGYSSTSLFELAKALGMSRGNLAYHFKDKDLLLEAIADEMWHSLEAERNKSRQLPSFENLHNEIQLYYKYQKKYAFIFLDTHVLNHPLIKKRFRELTAQNIQDNMATIAFSIKLGNMREEQISGTYHNIAFITWMLTFYWLSQQIIRGEKSREDGEKMIWSILLPHFTEKGIQSFKAFFGEEYFNSLGKPFDLDIQSLISF
ncbi:MAG: TetR/AcrR family transcriptional regulator [Bacteroidota bacterium]